MKLRRVATRLPPLGNQRQSTTGCLQDRVRSRDRQLNSALHTIAITQIRVSRSLGNAYYNTKIAEGKTPREAKRCLKRRLADHVWRTMIADEKRETPRTTDPQPHHGLTNTEAPKGTDLSTYTQAELDAVADELNNRPRQTLDWQKPTEVLNHFLVKAGGAPIT